MNSIAGTSNILKVTAGVVDPKAKLDGGAVRP
jgi:hypothetical protein